MACSHATSVLSAESSVRFPMKTLLASVLLIAPQILAAPINVEGYSHVRSADGVDE